MKEKLIACLPAGRKTITSSARKSRWGVKTDQIRDDSPKVVLQSSLSSEVLYVINEGM